MIHRGEKAGLEALEPNRCLILKGQAEVTCYLLIKEVNNMAKPLVSYAAGKDCKSLKHFFEEEEEAE